MVTYNEYVNQAASQKIGLVHIDARRQLRGFTLHSGSIYKYIITAPKMLSVEVVGVALSEVDSLSLVVPGTFFYDRSTSTLYVWLNDSSDPDNVFIVSVLRYYFSNTGLRLPHDLSTGYSVLWEPLLKSTSEFGVTLDNSRAQIGTAIEGKGKVSFHWDEGFWNDKFDRLSWENQAVKVYSWNENVQITQAQLLFSGTVQTKDFSTTDVSFGVADILNELRTPIQLTNIEDLVYTHSILGSISARITNSEKLAKQRKLYGTVKGHVPMNIDQVLEGYPLKGTITVATGSDVGLPGGGSDFQSQLLQNDKIIFNDFPEQEFTVRTFEPVSGNVILSEPYELDSGGAKSCTFIPERQHRAVNRYHLVAGHQLTAPSSTVSLSISPLKFEVADATDFFIGDTIVINGETRQITAIGDLRLITVNQSFAAQPLFGDTVQVSPIKKAYIGDKLMAENTDFTFDTTTSILKMNDGDDAPEVRLSAEFGISGTSITGTAGLKTITGIATFFTKQVAPGDYIFVLNLPYQVWSIESDTLLIVNKNVTVTGTDTKPRILKPKYYERGETVVSIDCNGKSDTGLATGALLQYGPKIVKDLLIEAGLNSVIETTSFDTANDIAQHNLSVVIPDESGDTSTPETREVITKINQSILGSLFQNNDFELEYSVLDPSKHIGTNVFRESDVISFDIDIESKNTIKAANVDFLMKEHDFSSNDSSFLTFRTLSDEGEYLINTDREHSLKTYLTDINSGRIMSGRWTFLLSAGRSEITIKTKLLGALLHVNDKIELIHSKLFQRFGNLGNRKIGLVSSIKVGLSTSVIKMDDLGNAFSRVGTITENTANNYDLADIDEKNRNGFITSNTGLLNSDPDTTGINLIW